MSQSTPASSSRRRPKRAAKTTRRTNAAKRTRRAKDQSDTVEANAAPRRESPSHLEDLGLPPEPKSKRRLNEIAESLLGVRFPDRALCPQHHSPMDYLYKSFVEQKDLLVWANRGGGKTMLAAAATLLDALYRAPVKIRILGGSFDQSDRLADYVREFVQRRPELVAAPMRKDRVGVVGGSEIRMLAQSQRAVRGQHVQKIRCDEVDLFDADVWQAVQFATRSREETRGSIEVLSTLHRQGGLMHDLVEEARNTDAAQSFGYHLVSWCLWEVIERCHPRRRCDDCLLEEDCQGIARRAAGFFPIDDAIAIKARSSRSAWQAEMLCRGPQRRDVVFGEFDPAMHVRSVEFCADWPLYRAIDFGYSAPLVCLWVQLTPDGAVHVIQEHCQARQPLGLHARKILETDPGVVQATYVDPAGRQKESTSGAACTELLASVGIPCTSRASTIADGLELIRAALAPAVGEAKLFIHPRCKTLIESFQNYHYPSPNTAGAAGENPVKDGPDHAIDALRYFFINRMRPRIETLRKRY